MTEFPLLKIWTKFRCKMIISYYTHTHALMKVAKLNRGRGQLEV